jgi:hypothetical protein
LGHAGDESVLLGEYLTLRPTRPTYLAYAEKNGIVVVVPAIAGTQGIIEFRLAPQ